MHVISEWFNPKLELKATRLPSRQPQHWRLTSQQSASEDATCTRQQAACPQKLSPLRWWVCLLAMTKRPRHNCLQQSKCPEHLPFCGELYIQSMCHARKAGCTRRCRHRTKQQQLLQATAANPRAAYHEGLGAVIASHALRVVCTLRHAVSRHAGYCQGASHTLENACRNTAQGATNLITRAHGRVCFSPTAQATGTECSTPSTQAV